MNASIIPASALVELSQLLARAFLRHIATRSEHTDVNVSASCARNSQNRVDEIAHEEQLCVHADGGAHE